jgi:hypothetical protein
LAVRVVASICSSDVRSTTGSNLLNIGKESQLDPVRDLFVKVKSALLSLKKSVPMEDFWRVGCLRKFLSQRHAMAARHEDTVDMDRLIDSLCTS